MLDISVIMPYFHRPEQLKNTLDSYWHFYHKEAEDIEIILIDDGSPTEEARKILLRSGFPHASYVRLDREKRGNPTVPFNMGVEMAKSPLLLLTNPENMHLGNVIDDAVENAKPNTYRCYACRTVRQAKFSDVMRDPMTFTLFAETPRGFYQHSRHSNRMIYFCALLTKETFLKVGGIDEQYSDGYAWEDSDFVLRMREANINFEAVDSPEVAHQEHARFPDSDGWARNHKIFKERWGRESGLVFAPDSKEVLR